MSVCPWGQLCAQTMPLPPPVPAVATSHAMKVTAKEPACLAGRPLLLHAQRLLKCGQWASGWRQRGLWPWLDAPLPCVVCPFLHPEVLPSSPSHTSCFYNAPSWAALPSSALSPEVPLRGLASPCTQASPGEGLQWQPAQWGPSSVLPRLTVAEPRPAGQLPPLNHSPRLTGV